MSFRIRGLDPSPFRHLYGLSDAELAKQGVRRCVARSKPDYPDRIEMRDAEIGETLLLLNYTHQPADSPYRSSHAILVREGASETYDAVDEIPEVFAVRTMSLRGFDDNGMMQDASLATGDGIATAIEQLLAQPEIAYVHAHYALMGCFAARVDRA